MIFCFFSALLSLSVKYLGNPTARNSLYHLSYYNPCILLNYHYPYIYIYIYISHYRFHRYTDSSLAFRLYFFRCYSISLIILFPFFFPFCLLILSFFYLLQNILLGFHCQTPILFFLRISPLSFMSLLSISFF